MSDDLRDWALKQPLFWVASAPRTGDHVNVSPKGMPSATFTVFDANHCAYVDATGSGSETVAHIYENGRVTLCWCSFDSTPRILRWYCWGRVIEHDSPDFSKMLECMGHPRVAGARAIIMLEVFKVGTSCGMSVPLLEAPQSHEEEMHNDSSTPMRTTAARQFKQRESLKKWASVMESKNKMLGYRQNKNARSLDGLPSIRAARRGKGERMWVEDVKVAVRSALRGARGVMLGFLTGFIVALILQRSPDRGIHGTVQKV